jgi:class 3 adenylate cyclase
MFSDIEQSTAATERLGDLRAQEMLRIHNQIVRQNLAEFGGFEVKTLGDGFMVAFPSPRRAVLCAISILKEMARPSDRYSERLPRVRMGLHTGEPIREAGDFFGKSVIIAARIGAVAEAGEILLSAATKEMVQEAGDLSFDAGREVKLKGLSGTYTVFAVQP